MNPRPTDTTVCETTKPADSVGLLDRLRRGEPGAYEELVSSQSGWMFAVARRLVGNADDAADVVQEAFAKVWRNLGSFRGDSALTSWMKRIVINEALQRLRGRARRPETSLDGLLPTFDDTGHRVEVADAWQESADQLLERKEMVNSVRRCVERLPDAYRTVLVLRDVEELSTEATAEVIGIRPGAVKTRLHRARLALRTLIERELTADCCRSAPGTNPCSDEGPQKKPSS